MYYKNKNISYSQKLLNPVIKYKKCQGKNDCYTTKTGLKTDQKVYKNKSKSGLIAYIKKEGNNFYSKKKLKDDEGVKHLIISPIDPKIYNKLNDEEKKELQQIIVKQLFKDFAGFAFIGGVEQKKRGELDHFHIHLAITEKYDIKPQNIDFLKRSITKTILNSKFKSKLGLKTKNELTKETFNNKYKELYQDKKNIYNEISFLFNELININNEIKEERYEIKNIKYEIGELNDQRKTELQYISRERDFLLFDIKDTKQILKQKNESLRRINNEFKNVFESFNKEKNNIYNLLYGELQALKSVLNDELKYFKYILNNEHNIYVKTLKYQLKNKIIDLPTFLYLVASNKYYIKKRQQIKSNEIKQIIKNKQNEITKKLQQLQYKLKYKLKDLENKKSFIKFCKSFDEKKLQNLLNKLKELNKNKKNIIENYFLKISLLYEYLYERQQKYFKLQQQKQLKQQQINNKKQKLNNVNKEQDELQKLIHNNNITEVELTQVYNNFLKDKVMFPHLKFEDYLKAYIKQKQLKQQNKNKNKVKNIFKMFK